MTLETSFGFGQICTFPGGHLQVANRWFKRNVYGFYIVLFGCSMANMSGLEPCTCETLSVLQEEHFAVIG